MFVRIDKTLNNQLIYAYNDGDIKKFKKLIEEGSNVNCLFTITDSLIATVVKNLSGIENNKEFFIELLKNDVIIDPIYENCNGLLYLAICNEDIFYMEKLIEHGISTEECDIQFGNFGNSAIFNVLEIDDESKLKLILKQKPNLKRLSGSGYTIIEYLLRKNIDSFEKYVPILVEAGVDLNQLNSNGLNVFQIMYEINVKPRHFDILIEHNGNINYLDENGEPFIKKAISIPNIKAIEFMLNKGVDINEKYKNGFTALMYALILDKFDAFSYLINKGANLDITNDDGDNIAHIAYRNLNINKTFPNFLCDLLCENPKILTMKNNLNMTPMDVFKTMYKNNKNMEIYSKLSKSVENINTGKQIC